MVRQAGMTGAESVWEDSVEDEEGCEKFLQTQKSKLRASAEEDVDAEEDEVADDEDEPSDDDSVEDESADEDEDPSAEAQPEGNKMAKAKAGKTKAESIREVIESLKAKGEELRPRNIIAALEKKGVEVNASQVSITLRSMGVPAIKRGAGKPAKEAKTAEHNGESRSRIATKLVTPVTKTAEPVADMDAYGDMLDTAATFMHEVGGYERAVSLLGICNKVMKHA
jgi:hypothetical protein